MYHDGRARTLQQSECGARAAQSAGGASADPSGLGTRPLPRDDLLLPPPPEGFVSAKHELRWSSRRRSSKARCLFIREPAPPGAPSVSGHRDITLSVLLPPPPASLLRLDEAVSGVVSASYLFVFSANSTTARAQSAAVPPFVDWESLVELDERFPGSYFSSKSETGSKFVGHDTTRGSPAVAGGRDLPIEGRF